MNFLGHFLLSFGKPNLIVGNYIADGVKGKKYLDYPSEIAEGILLHRKIDHFTDTHLQVKSSAKRLFPNYGHYSSVIVDIFYDHFLAKDWNQYHKELLDSFSSNIYKTLKKNSHIIPDQYNFMLSYMSRDNWLLGYRKIEGIERALRGLSKRIKYNTGIEKAGEDLRLSYQNFQVEFDNFMKDLLPEFKSYK